VRNHCFRINLYIISFLKDLTLVAVKKFERPQLLHLNIEMVIKRGFIAFWRWLCREVLLYFERPFENFDRSKLLENTGYNSPRLSSIAILHFCHCSSGYLELRASACSGLFGMVWSHLAYFDKLFSIFGPFAHGNAGS